MVCYDVTPGDAPSTRAVNDLDLLEENASALHHPNNDIHVIVHVPPLQVDRLLCVWRVLALMDTIGLLHVSRQHPRHILPCDDRPHSK